MMLNIFNKCEIFYRKWSNSYMICDLKIHYEDSMIGTFENNTAGTFGRYWRQLVHLTF